MRKADVGLALYDGAEAMREECGLDWFGIAIVSANLVFDFLKEDADLAVRAHSRAPHCVDSADEGEYFSATAADSLWLYTNNLLPNVKAHDLAILKTARLNSMPTAAKIAPASYV
jgi:hypothetical protein